MTDSRTRSWGASAIALAAVLVMALTATASSSRSHAHGAAMPKDATVAAAAIGDLTFKGFVSRSSLDGASFVAMSPDGGDVYVTSLGAGSLTHLTRGSEGALAFGSCVAADGPSGECTDPPKNAIGGGDLVVSPAGDSIYVLGGTSLAHFSVSSSGTPTFVECYAAAGNAAGCAPMTGLISSNAIAVSPDGANVYVGNDDQVTVLSVQAGGALTHVVEPFPYPADGLVVSPDGGDVYAADEAGGSSGNVGVVVHYLRGAGGALTKSSCVATGGEGDCADPAMESLQGVSRLVLSPDGEDIYAVAQPDLALTHLSHDDAGDLEFRGCVDANASSGSGCATAGAMGGPMAVVVSPDGKSVYTTAKSNTDSVAHFVRAADGSLTYSSCVAQNLGAACTKPNPGSSPFSAIDDPFELVVSPDSKDVYVASAAADTVSHLSRSAAVAPPPVQDSDGDGVPDGSDACPSQQGPAATSGCPVPAVDDQACTKAKQKLDKAKAKLKKLKRDDAPTKAIEQAKMKLKKAKSAVKKACD